MFFFFQWAQLKHKIRARWKTLISNYSNINEKKPHQNHNVIIEARILSINKLSAKEIYYILISNIVNNLPQTSILKNSFKTQL